MSCPICDFDDRFLIAQGERVAACIYPPDAVMPGHVLVYPLAHREGLSALSDAEAAELFTLARRLCAALEQATGAAKCYPLAIGDVNPHFHLHLLPKQADDAPIGPFIMGAEGYAGKIRKPVTEEATLALIAKLQSALTP